MVRFIVRIVEWRKLISIHCVLCFWFRQLYVWVDGSKIFTIKCVCERVCVCEVERVNATIYLNANDVNRCVYTYKLIEVNI